jgi:hypothetical protein
MTLTVITKSGRKRHFIISYAHQVPNILKLVTEPISGYTLIRNDGTVEDVTMPVKARGVIQ